MYWSIPLPSKVTAPREEPWGDYPSPFGHRVKRVLGVNLDCRRKNGDLELRGFQLEDAHAQAP